MSLGIVKWFDIQRGFGFIVNDEGNDVFVHYTSIVGDGFRSLREGDKVEFDQLNGEKGLHAGNVRRIDG